MPGPCWSSTPPSWHSIQNTRACRCHKDPEAWQPGLHLPLKALLTRMKLSKNYTQFLYYSHPAYPPLSSVASRGPEQPSPTAARIRGRRQRSCRASSTCRAFCKAWQKNRSRRESRVAAQSRQGCSCSQDRRQEARQARRASPLSSWGYSIHSKSWGPRALVGWSTGKRRALRRHRAEGGVSGSHRSQSLGCRGVH